MTTATSFACVSIVNSSLKLTDSVHDKFDADAAAATAATAAASTDNDAATQEDTNANMTNTKTMIDVWVCDVCKVARFNTFEEACRHEERCAATSSLSSSCSSPDPSAAPASVVAIDANDDNDGDDDDDDDNDNRKEETNGCVDEMDAATPSNVSLSATRSFLGRRKAVHGNSSVEDDTNETVAGGTGRYGDTGEEAAVAWHVRDSESAATERDEEKGDDDKEDDDIDDIDNISDSPRHRQSLSPPPPPPPPPTHPLTTTLTPFAASKSRKRWVCDVCRKASFLTYDEADAHENECAEKQGQRVPLDDEDKKNDVIDVIDVADTVGDTDVCVVDATTRDDADADVDVDVDVNAALAKESAPPAIVGGQSDSAVLSGVNAVVTTAAAADENDNDHNTGVKIGQQPRRSIRTKTLRVPYTELLRGNATTGHKKSIKTKQVVSASMPTVHSKAALKKRTALTASTNPLPSAPLFVKRKSNLFDNDSSMGNKDKKEKSTKENKDEDIVEANKKRRRNVTVANSGDKGAESSNACNEQVDCGDDVVVVVVGVSDKVAGTNNKKKRGGGTMARKTNDKPLASIFGGGAGAGAGAGGGGGNSSTLKPFKKPVPSTANAVVAFSKCTHSAEMLAEHRAVEFAAQRRIERERERERRKKRQLFQTEMRCKSSNNNNNGGGGGGDDSGGIDVETAESDLMAAETRALAGKSFFVRGGMRNAGSAAMALGKVGFGGGGWNKKRQRGEAGTTTAGSSSSSLSAAAAPPPLLIGTVVDLASGNAPQKWRPAAKTSSSPSSLWPSGPAFATRFPIPTHVMGAPLEPSASSVTENESPKFSRARAALRTFARYPAGDDGGGVALRDDDDENGDDNRHDDEEAVPSSIIGRASILANDAWLKKAKCEGNRDQLADALSAALIPTPIAISDGDGDGDKNRDSGSKKTIGVLPWSDKHCIRHLPHDVCGDPNRAVARELLEFVGEWKKRRGKVLVRRAEAHAERARISNKRSGSGGGGGNNNNAGRRVYKTRYLSEDDDFWDGSDADDDGCGGRGGSLPNVFLLTGPTGSGKTNLVHAAARQSECVVVEINTSERRGGAALKRAIEECTQSDSSLAMLKRRDAVSSSEFLPGELHRLDEEERDDDGDRDDEDKKRAHKKDDPTIALVLIDEADNIFEGDGDAGFWPALSQLSKKAKCPILLTSHAVPPALRDSAIRFRTAALARPTPEECAEWMVRIAQEEGMALRVRGDGGCCDCDGDARRWLALAAEMCDCDLRKILNEMQAFSRGAVSPSVCTDGRIERANKEGDKCNMVHYVDCLDRAGAPKPPVITGIEPRTVPYDCHTLIAIRGEHFGALLGESDEEYRNVDAAVYIGGRRCPAMRVIDSTTILAVCPPCPLPFGVDGSGAFVAGDYAMEDCITCRYAPVSVKIRAPTGLVLTSDATAASTKPEDLPSYGARIWNLEYYFPDGESQLDKVCKKKNLERSRKRLRKRGPNMVDDAVVKSSSDDDFDVPKFCSVAVESGATEEKSSVSIADAAVAKASSNGDLSSCGQRASKCSLAATDNLPDLVAILEDSDKSYLLAKELSVLLDSKSRKNAEVRSQRYTNVIFESSSSECSSSPVKSKISGTKVDCNVHNMEEWARQIALSSDAVVIEESLTTMAIPALSGATRGFGSELVHMVQNCVSKNLGKPPAKPPSIERLYANRWNESSFFFGTSDCYFIQPSSKRDRRLLALASLSHQDSLLDYSQPAADLSVSSEFHSEDSFTVVPEDPATMPDDMFLLPYYPVPLSLLPSLMRFGPGTSRPCETKATELHRSARVFTRRAAERATSMFSDTLCVLQDRVQSSCHCLGLSYTLVGDNEIFANVSSLSESGQWLDRRYALDYLPALRTISVHEHEADKRFLEAMNLNSEGGLSSTRRVSRRRGPFRENYFDEYTWDLGKRFDGTTVSGKNICANLSRTCLMFASRAALPSSP